MARTDLTKADLQPGDLIVWKMSDEASHVEMFTGTTHFAATSIHAVNTPAKGLTRVMANSFAGAFFKHIFRCTKAGMALSAAQYASQWARYETRYDKNRIDVKTAFREMHRNLGTSADDMNRMMINRFMELGRFRAIKYAARRNGILCYPGDDGNNGHGMTCCMFAILCYQVAGIANEVVPLDPADPLLRVSDKKMDQKDLATLKRQMQILGFDGSAFREYQAYVTRIQEQNEYRIDWAAAGKPVVDKGVPAAKHASFRYCPSILMWEHPATFHSFDWLSAVTPGMMLDAKIANPQHVWSSLDNDKTNWTYLGSMAAEQIAATPEQKTAYQAALDANKIAATAARVPFQRA